MALINNSTGWWLTNYSNIEAQLGEGVRGGTAYTELKFVGPDGNIYCMKTAGVTAGVGVGLPIKGGGAVILRFLEAVRGTINLNIEMPSYTTRVYGLKRGELSWQALSDAYIVVQGAGAAFAGGASACIIWFVDPVWPIANAFAFSVGAQLGLPDAGATVFSALYVISRNPSY